MSFMQPHYFWLFLFLLAAYLKGDMKNIKVTSFGYMVTFIFIVIALSRPVILKEPVKDKEYVGDVVVALDFSYSMHGEDIKPSRLKKAKEVLLELVKHTKNDRYGIVVFTTNAIILSPLTQDSQILTHLFKSLDENYIMTKGSAIMPALKLSRKLSRSKNLRVVILTDGADNDEYGKEALFAKNSSMIVNIFMLATKTGSTLKLPNTELLKDADSNIVVSRQNSAIKEISDVTGGVYVKNIDELLDALDGQRDKDAYLQSLNVRNTELFYVFVVLAIISFLFSVTNLKRYIIALLLLVGISLDASSLKEANTIYRSGKYDDALVLYKSLKSSDVVVKSVIFYNMGNTLVRLKRFKDAKEAYKKSLMLHYSKEAYENLLYIIFADDEKKPESAKLKTTKKSSLAKKDKRSSKKKNGAKSNMDVAALSGNSDEKGMKKTAGASSLDFDTHKAKLSSKQYELINKRVVDEKKPW